jgi:HAMP domain-containing protein
MEAMLIALVIIIALIGAFGLVVQLRIVAELQALTRAVDSVSARGPAVLSELRSTQVGLKATQTAVEEVVEVLNRPE